MASRERRRDRRRGMITAFRIGSRGRLDAGALSKGLPHRTAGGARANGSRLATLVT